MFGFIKNQLKKMYDSFTTKVQSLFLRVTVDEATLEELEHLLIGADVGVTNTRTIINAMRTKIKTGHIAQGSDLHEALQADLAALIQTQPYNHTSQAITLLVGINGSGKTTCAAKLAHEQKAAGKKVLLVAADTFRAAAVEQLTAWSQKLDISLAQGSTHQDPAAVVFQACERFKNEGFDSLIIDTAGRLQTKVNLMKELEKIKRTISRHFPDTPINTLLVIDSMLGQNSLEQARLFHESTHVNGIVLTKMDGTGKGGIVFAIAQELKIPVAYISFGENIEQYKQFDAIEFVSQLLGEREQ